MRQTRESGIFIVCSLSIRCASLLLIDTLVVAKSKKERRQAAKRLRKLVASNPAQLAPKIPLVERSIDLPSNPQHSIQGAIEASEARQELTRALRAKRRASIKEKNFLKGMR